MIASITVPCSQNGRPTTPSEDGINGSIRDHCSSLNTEVRDIDLIVTDQPHTYWDTP